MFLVVSRSDVHFGFDHPFFACLIGHASKTARPEIWAPRTKFARPFRQKIFRDIQDFSIFRLVKQKIPNY